MFSLVLVATGSPGLFSGVMLLYLVAAEHNRLHHLTEKSVGKYHRGHSVLVRFVERFSHQVCHFLHGGRRKHEYLEIAMPQRLCRLPVIALRGLNSTQTRTAAHYIHDNAGKVGTSHVGHAFALQGNSRGGAGSHAANAGTCAAIHHVDRRDLALSLQKNAPNLWHSLCHVRGNFSLRCDRITEKALAAGSYRGFCQGFVALHQISFHHLSPPSALMVIAQSGHIIAHIAHAMQASSSMHTAV